MNLSRKSVAHMTILSVVAGGIGMALDQGVFLILLPYMDKYLANALAISVGTIVSFYFNIFFIFKVRRKIGLRFILFFLTGIFGVILSSAVIWLGTVPLHLPTIPVRWFSLFFVALVQFFVNLFGAFGRWFEKELK